MYHHGLLPLLRDTGEYGQLRRQLTPPGSSHQTTIPESAIPYAGAVLQQYLQVPVCIIDADPERAAALRDEMEWWVPPEWR